MYWGPAPALVAFLPWRLLTGQGLDTAWAVLFFTAAGWLFASLLLLHIVRHFFPCTGPAVRFSVLLALGVGNFAIVVLQRPSVYEVSIAAAYAFTSLFWWQLAVALCRPPALRATPLTVASLALGLAVTSRPSWIVVSPVFFVAMWDMRSEWQTAHFRKLVGHATVPVTACVFVVLLLNFARFDDPFEFGVRYQLNDDPIGSSLFALRHVPFGVGMYLFAPPVTTDYFPFLLPSAADSLPVASREVEDVFGLLPLLPLLWVSAFSLPALRVAGLKRLVVIVVAGFAAILGLLSMYLAVTVRYEMELASLLAVLAAIGLLVVVDRWRGNAAWRRLAYSVWSVMLVATLVTTFLAACSLSLGRSSPYLTRIALWANAAAHFTGWSGTPSSTGSNWISGFRLTSHQKGRKCWLPRAEQSSATLFTGAGSMPLRSSLVFTRGGGRMPSLTR